MHFNRTLSYLMSAIVLCGPVAPLLNAQQSTANPGTTLAVSSAAPAASSPAVAVPLDAAVLPSASPLSEDELRTRYVGKLIFLRGAYLGDNLDFDKEGRIVGLPDKASFTLSAFEVRKITLSKKKLDIEADRYGLHYLGALPFEDEGKSYDRVKISKKPVHISIERELVVTPKVKKDKKNKDEPTPAELAAAQTLKGHGVAVSSPNSPAAGATAVAAPPKAQPAPVAAVETAEAPGSVSPAHSAMMMNKALDTIFAADLDARMMAQLPAYWQGYFASKKEHRPFTPAGGNVRVLADGVTPPRVLNRIDPSSNEFAQQYGIAGMEMVRTVVDANGVPQQMAISRPIGFGLDEKAVEAVKNSHFKPAMVNGQAVPVVIDLVVTFRIYSNRTMPGSVTAGSGAKDTKESVMAAAVAENDGSKDGTIAH